MTAPQLAANRANALLSTGPQTPEGKLRSSRNAFKHGLCGKIHAAAPEDQAAFDRHCRAYLDALAPAGLVEDELAQAIAEDEWRLKRARALENSIFAQGPESFDAETGNPEVDAALSAGQTWIEQSRNLQLLTLYEQRIHRALAKNVARLEALQAARAAIAAQAQDEAILLTDLAQCKGEIYDPAPDFPPAAYFGGFIYSSSEIVRLIGRAARLEEARNLASHARKSPSNPHPSSRNVAKVA